MTAALRSVIVNGGLGVIIGLSIAAGWLLLQGARNGWPFAGTVPHTIGAPAVSLPATQGATSGPARVDIQVDGDQLERLGVQYETLVSGALQIGSRYPVVIAPVESALHRVQPRVSGWVERIFVETGDPVRPGDAVVTVFSQELVASQAEYLTALKRAAENSASALLPAARARLEVLGLSKREIERLEQSGEVQRLVTIRAPRAGIVLRRAVTAGAGIDPSTEIVTIADFTRVWALAEVPAEDAAAIRPGSKASLSFASSQNRLIDARVDFVYSTLTERTRTVRVRFALNNPHSRLRPGMYGTASFALAARSAVSVPRDAIVDTGDSQHVFVRQPDGSLSPRAIVPGARTADRVEVLEGLGIGDVVVTSGVFLIDSESRLRASGVGPAHAGHSGSSDRSTTGDSGDHSGHGS